MRKLHYLPLFILIIAMATTLFLIFSTPSTTGVILNVKCDSVTNVVDKTQGEAFQVKVTFKNAGNATGTWDVNVAFESESSWNWKGTPQTLVLKPSKTTTLTWTGNVPEEAEANSTARLIVYFGDQFAAQNWWIHVLPSAELEIVSSKVS
jgi:uncharacterized membrane protein